MEVRAEARFEDVPGFGECTVPGHRGKLLRGALAGAEVLVFLGRRHLYEGISAARAALPSRVSAALGARVLISLSAAGAVDPAIPVGAWVLVQDHLNLMGRNPLDGVSGPEGPAFVDLTRTYRTDLHDRLEDRLSAAGLRVFRGVLAAFAGPSYETPAEIRMARTLGASVVGMSTVPEAVWARFLGLDVLALARVSNSAAGMAPGPLRHADVVREMERGAEDAGLVAEEAIRAWHAEG